MPKLHIVSLGCTKNLVDTEVMLGRLKQYELTDQPSDADVIIINTCGFIDSAKEESINTVLTLDKQRKKESLLVMAGCLSERYRDELKQELKEIDIFTGVGDYANIDQLLASRQSHFTPQTFLQKDEERVITGSGYHAYIKISEGCNQQCSFCAIPTFKGKLHSRSIASIIIEIQSLIKRGYFDFTLIAQDTSSFGIDNDQDLITLINEIDQIEGVECARLCYLYPSTTSAKLINTIAASKRFLPYFDMPIQHASNDMLKTMKRGLNRHKTLELIRQMRAVPNSYLRTAFIVGHPHETDEDFAEICELISQNIFDRVSLFEFSDEENTAAHKMSAKVDTQTVKNRLKTVQKLLAKSHKKAVQKYIGQTISAVINGISAESEYLIEAKAALFAPEIDPKILITDTAEKPLKHGEKVRVLITKASGDELIGEIKR